MTLLEPVFDGAAGLFNGLFKVVVDDGDVKVFTFLQFGAAALDASCDGLFAVGAAAAEAMLKFLDTRGHDKDGERVVAKDAFEVATAVYINIENDDMSVVLNAFDFAFEGAVAGALVNLFPFHEFVAGHFGLELLVGDEIVFHTVLLVAARCARGGGDGKFKAVEVLAKMIDDGGLSTTGWGGEEDDFALVHCVMCVFRTGFIV